VRQVQQDPSAALKLYDLDLVYFGNNVHLPMPGGDQVPTTKAPWVLIGGSYPGALVSWTMVA
jgi:hypothetical protein